MFSENDLYHHEKELSLSSTIPSHWYTSNTFFKKEIPTLFNQSWNLVGSLNSLQNKGDYFTAQAGHENFIIVKPTNDSTELQGLVNVCRHRAGPVAAGCGNLAAFQCRYHGWVYDLKGKLIGTPEFQGVENFQKEDCPLPQVELATLGPLVFASLKPKANFDAFCGNLQTKLNPDFFSAKLTPFLTRDYQVKCNWKVYVDNYLEGYHLPLVHKGLSAELDYSQYETRTSEWFSEQIAPAKPSAAYYRSEKGSGAQYFWLFPNTMFNIYQDMVQTNVVVPISADETIVKFVWYSSATNVEKNRAAIDEMIYFSDLIQEEDRLICEQVQKNLNSSTYESGRYSVKRENGVHHFHQLLAKLRL